MENISWHNHLHIRDTRYSNCRKPIRNSGTLLSLYRLAWSKRETEENPSSSDNVAGFFWLLKDLNKIEIPLTTSSAYTFGAHALGKTMNASRLNKVFAVPTKADVNKGFRERICCTQLTWTAWPALLSTIWNSSRNGVGQCPSNYK